MLANASCNGCTLAVGDTFDRPHRAAARLHRQQRARLDAPTIEMDDAGSTLAGFAAAWVPVNPR